MESRRMLAWILGIILIIALVILGTWLSMNRQDNQTDVNENQGVETPQNQPDTNNNTTPNNTTPPQTQGDTEEVAISNFVFNPNSLTIAKGTTVTWTNNDSVSHDVASDNGSFKSPILNQGEKYQFTFNDAGTFSYICSIHPSMKGTIIVQ